MFNKLKAFTMAEVLLVLGIIGVVAAITIPNLKDSADEQVYVAKAGKIYSEMETAFSRSSMKYGNVNDWSGIANNTIGTAVGSKMVKYIDGSICGTGANIKCWVNDYTTNKTVNAAYKITLKDGASVAFFNDLTVDNFTGNALTILVDVDGSGKGADTLGIDQFYMYVLSASAMSDGSHNVAINATPTSSDYLGWVLKYGNEDYMKCASNLKWYSDEISCN